MSSLYLHEEVAELRKSVPVLTQQRDALLAALKAVHSDLVDHGEASIDFIESAIASVEGSEHGR